MKSTLPVIEPQLNLPISSPLLLFEEIKVHTFLLPARRPCFQVLVTQNQKNLFLCGRCRTVIEAALSLLGPPFPLCRRSIHGRKFLCHRSGPSWCQVMPHVLPSFFHFPYTVPVLDHRVSTDRFGFPPFKISVFEFVLKNYPCYPVC